MRNDTKKRNRGLKASHKLDPQKFYVKRVKINSKATESGVSDHESEDTVDTGEETDDSADDGADMDDVESSAGGRASEPESVSE